MTEQPTHIHTCPACDRPFGSIFDYATVLIVNAIAIPASNNEPLPIPQILNKVPTEYQEMLRDYLERQKREAQDKDAAAEKLRQRHDVKAYLSHLKELVGQTVKRDSLVPPFEPLGRSGQTYRLPESKFSLSIHHTSRTESERGLAKIEILGPGPNLGSAGGPTMQVLTTLMTMSYIGMLSHVHQACR